MAIAALVSSALIFSFGYRRTRKSEQIKIASEQMNRISDLLIKRNEAIMRGYPDDFQGAYSKWAYARDISEECERFGYMVYSKTILGANTIRYYEPSMFEHFSQVNKFVGNYAKLVREHCFEDYERYAESHIKILEDIITCWGGIITYRGSNWITAARGVIDALNEVNLDQIKQDLL